MLALLLVLLGVPVAVAPGAGESGQYGVTVTGESMPAAPPARDDLRDWLRLSVARHASNTALLDAWCAMCPRAANGCAPHGRLLVGAAGDTRMAASVLPPHSSRAPPLA
jgi:hypothetical protein